MLKKTYYLTTPVSPYIGMLISNFITDSAVRIEEIDGKFKLAFPTLDSRRQFLRILDAHLILYKLG